MIAEADLAELYQRGSGNLDNPGLMQSRDLLCRQFFRGESSLFINKQPVSCERNKAIFNTYNIIPEHCFACYKVLITPRNVVELFKLMVIFEKFDLPNNNCRKCMVETRDNVSGAYKGFIYCLGLEDANKVFEMTRNVVAEEISDKVAVTMKRGCSEYASSYPRYQKVGRGPTIMKYKKKWKEFEDAYDKGLVYDSRQIATSHAINPPDFTIQDFHAMHFWLTYAATIGDLSYQKITGGEIPPFTNLSNRAPFVPAED